MSLTASVMMPLGTTAPDFSLINVIDGKTVSLDTFNAQKALLIMFICQHCPYVQHVKGELAKIGADYKDKALGIVAISANDAKNFPDDAPVGLAAMAHEEGFLFPFLYDETQDVAKAYTAACTQDFFLFDKDEKLVYRGQLDDSRPGINVPLTGRDLRAAIDQTLAGERVSESQKPSTGCNSKWIQGNEPSYYNS